MVFNNIPNLKANRAVSVHVKSIEEEMCICGGIWKKRKKRM